MKRTSGEYKSKISYEGWSSGTDLIVIGTILVIFALVLLISSLWTYYYEPSFMWEELAGWLAAETGLAILGLVLGFRRGRVTIDTDNGSYTTWRGLIVPLWKDVGSIAELGAVLIDNEDVVSLRVVKEDGTRRRIKVCHTSDGKEAKVEAKFLSLALGLDVEDSQIMQAELPVTKLGPLLQQPSDDNAPMPKLTEDEEKRQPALRDARIVVLLIAGVLTIGAVFLAIFTLNQGVEIGPQDDLVSALPKQAWFAPAAWLAIGIAVSAICSFVIMADASSRGMAPAGWGIFTLFMFLIAVPMYLVARKPRIRDVARAAPLAMHPSSPPFGCQPPMTTPPMDASECKCPDCGTHLSGVEQACPECGRPMKEFDNPKPCVKFETDQPKSERVTESFSIKEKLVTLRELRDSGLISEEEFQAKRQSLLDKF